MVHLCLVPEFTRNNVVYGAWLCWGTFFSNSIFFRHFIVGQGWTWPKVFWSWLFKVVCKVLNREILGSLDDHDWREAVWFLQVLFCPNVALNLSSSSELVCKFPGKDNPLRRWFICLFRSISPKARSTALKGSSVKVSYYHTKPIR